VRTGYESRRTGSAPKPETNEWGARVVPIGVKRGRDVGGRLMLAMSLLTARYRWVTTLRGKGGGAMQGLGAFFPSATPAYSSTRTSASNNTWVMLASPGSLSDRGSSPLSRSPNITS
jgi:hypothetical protein